MSRVLAIAGLAFALLLFATPASADALPSTSQRCTPSPLHSSKAQASPWAQSALDYSDAWKFSKGAGVKVAVIDSGVDANSQFGNRVQVGRTFASAPSGPANSDCAGHGTMVAGIIAAAPASGTMFEGVAPEATIDSIKVANSENQSISTAVLAQAVAQAISDHARVINISIATPSNDPQLQGVITYAVQHNIVVVAAAGNDQNGQKGPFYPASYPGVLSVGAVDSSGTLDMFSDRHSNAGVTAPGVDVTSTFPGSSQHSYRAMDGTSLAAPFVSGLAALIIANDPGLTAQQVVQRIEETAYGNAGTGTGHGLINPVQAVTAVFSASGNALAAPSRSSAAVTGTRQSPRNWSGIMSAMGIVAGVFAALALLFAVILVVPSWLGLGRASRRRSTPPRARPTADLSSKRKILLTPLSSLLVALVMVCVFGVLRTLSPANATGLDNPGTLVIDGRTGTLYVPCDANKLCPAINETSALLALDTSRPNRVTVNDSAINRHNKGQPVGIPGLPQQVPGETSLVKGSWAACATRLSSSTSNAYTSSVLVGGHSVGGRALSPQESLLVSPQPGADWLVRDGERFPLQPQEKIRLGISTAQSFSVSPAWLDAIPEGPLSALPSVGRPTLVSPATSACIADTSPGSRPAVVVGAAIPRGAVEVPASGTSHSGTSEVWLPPGKSALVGLTPSSVPSAARQWALVTGATRYSLRGPDIAAVLGYQLASDSIQLPASWLWLLPHGPTLDPVTAASPAPRHG